MKEIASQYRALSLCFREPEDPALKSEYTRLFSLTVAGGIPPYETEYGHKDIFFKTQRLADIAGFYRAFGLEMNGPDQPQSGVEGGTRSGSAGRGGDASPYRERVDHIGAELELMHWLTLKEEMATKQGKSEEAGICRDAATKFLQDHLGRWGSYFADQLAKSARLPFYKKVGQSLLEVVESECGRLGAQPERVTGWNPEPISATEFECGTEPR